MSLLGFGQSGIAYCHMCSSNQCHHIFGTQQQMSQQDYYDALRRMGAAQICVTSGGGAGGNSGGSGASAIIPMPPDVIGITLAKKPNKKLLLLRR